MVQLYADRCGMIGLERYYFERIMRELDNRYLAWKANESESKRKKSERKPAQPRSGGKISGRSDA